MEINHISNKYKVRKLINGDIDIIYNLMKENPLFYEFCPPFVTKESIMEDLIALPPNVPIENKYYIGFFKEEKLVAIMDLIYKFPNSNTAFIGLFMMDKNEQGKGIGSNIISDCAKFLKDEGFSRIRLAYAKGNPQSSSFWRKNHFVETGETSESTNYTAILMERQLQKIPV